MAKRKTKPFWKSKTIMGLAAAAVVVAILPRLGYPAPAEYVNEIYLALVSLVVYGLRDGNKTDLSFLPNKKKKDEPGNGAG